MKGTKKSITKYFLKSTPRTNMLPLAGIEPGLLTMTALENGYGTYSTKELANQIIIKLFEATTN